MGLIYGIKYRDKIVYVGQTRKTLQERIKLYKRAVSDDRKSQYVINHLRKHFSESEFIVLYTSSENENLDELEIKYIAEYKTLYPSGMNLTEGGRAPVFSEETRKKMSNSRLGKIPWNKDKVGVMKTPWNKGLKLGPQSEEIKNKKKRFKEQNHFYGKKHTQESLRKMSENRKGYAPPNKIKGKVYKYDAEWNLVHIYEDISEASKDGFNCSSINRSHKKKCKHKGFYFKRENYDDRSGTRENEGERICASVDDSGGTPDIAGGLSS